MQYLFETIRFMIFRLKNIFFVGIHLFTLGVVFSLPDTQTRVDTLLVSDFDPNQYIGKYTKYFIDHDNKIPFEEIRKKKFIQSGVDVLNFGFGEGASWIRFTVKNNTNEPFNKILQIQKPLQDSIQFYYRDEGNWMSTFSGVMIDNELKAIGGNTIYFPLKVNAQDTRQFYIRAVSKYGKSFAMKLIEEKEYDKYEDGELILIALIIGALFTLAVYNIFLGFGFKDVTYIAYALVIFFSMSVQATVRGFAYLYIIGNNDIVQEWWPAFIIAIGVVFLSYFCLKFLKTDQYSKSADYALKGLIVFTILSFFYEVIRMEVFGLYTTNRLIAVCTMAAGFVALYAGIVVYKKGNDSARYFIIAWSFYCLSIVIYVGTLLAVVPINWFSSNAYMLGSILEVSLLSFALVERYRSLEAEKLELSKNLLEKSKDVDRKSKEISSLLSESISHLKDKAELAENLTRVTKEEEGISLKRIIVNLQADKIDDEKTLFYKNNIEKLNRSFINQLKEKYPDLTATDIEMATFARVGLSKKEMAKLRNTTAEAIKKNRYRLRKKLNLPSDKSIEDFMENFGAENE